MKPNKLLIVSMLALPIILSACGGGKENVIVSTVPTTNVPVTAQQSPIQNTTGVKTSLSDGTQVYLLSENTNSDETKNMKIVSNPQKTGGDPSKLVGKTFLEFENLSGIHDKATVPAKEPVRVHQCDIKTAECIVISHTSLGNGIISFDVKEGKFYAIK